ncbi:MAG: hypothetical protein RBR89_06320 [Candidatus Bipolaricaulis sp.]|nr:hypothetical protein [Candidatus Bipolaricaulis sp.]
MTDTRADEVVDFSKLTQKELLLQMHHTLMELGNRMNEFKVDSQGTERKNGREHELLRNELNELRVRVSINDTKLKYFAAVAGFIAGAVASAMIKTLM